MPLVTPGKVRDAILTVLSTSGEALSVKEITERVCRMIGPPPTSSIRSYLALNIPETFVREGRGLYRSRSNGQRPHQMELPSSEDLQEPVRFGRAHLYCADCFDWLARREERTLAKHPSLKPQAFMRQVVRASLPLGEGVVLDPFAGAGSTLAAAEAVGYESAGIEKDPWYFDIAREGIPKLAAYRIKETVINGTPSSHAVS